MKKNLTKLALMLSLFAVVFLFINTGTTLASFNKNNLMSDLIFDKDNAMSANQINSFLNDFSNSCISPKKGFSAIDPTGYSPSVGYKYGSYVTAGKVIYDAAQAYDLNPRVILATLEKEQSLVTGRNDFNGYCNNGDEHKYTAAMGYGCPDSGTTHSYTHVSLYKRNGVTHSSTGTTCVNSKSKAGFAQQVIHAAWLFKFGEQRSKGNINWAIERGDWDNSDDLQACYDGPMTRGTHARGPSSCGTHYASAYYDGYITIDSTSTFMGSGATAALYWYTPHFHGNQTFVSIYERWFGSTQKNLNYRLIQCGSNKYLIERYIPTKRLLTDNAIREWGLEDSTFVADSKGCSYPSFTLSIDYVVQSRQSKNKYFLNGLTFYKLQSMTIANAWGLGDEYSAPIGETPMLNGDTLNDLNVELKLPRLARSSNTSKVYLMDGGKMFYITGTPTNETYLKLIRGGNEVPIAIISGEYLSLVKASAGQGGNISASFKVGSRWYLLDYAKARPVNPTYIADRWQNVGTLLNGPTLSGDVPGAVGNASGIGKGFKRDGRYYVIRVGGTPDSTTSPSMAKFWGVYNNPNITNLLKNVILSQ